MIRFRFVSATEKPSSKRINRKHARLNARGARIAVKPKQKGERKPMQTDTAEPKPTVQTKLHRYHISLTSEEGRADWRKLSDELRAKGLKHFHACGNKPPTHRERETIEDVTIELAHIFNDQWNTTTERVFDWFQYYEVNGAHCARGHWLEITDAMHAARMQTVSCGYCGKHYGRSIEQLSFEPIFALEPADGFCNACLDSPYLKETELHLLRLRPMSEDRGNRAPLTADEHAALLPKYVSRQTTGADSRSAQRREKQRRDVIEESEKDIRNATTERDDMLWLWDHGCDLDNVIFYNHTGKFSFGWRAPLSPNVKSKMLDVLSEFPFEYEFHK